jgi:hypothetical protein
MRNPQGYAHIIDPGARLLKQEFDTITCIHCGHVDMTRAGMTGRLEVLVYRSDGTHYMKEAGFCRGCFRPICPVCEGKPCTNRFKKLELEESAANKLICI